MLYSSTDKCTFPASLTLVQSSHDILANHEFVGLDIVERKRAKCAPRGIVESAKGQRDEAIPLPTRQSGTDHLYTNRCL